MVHNVSLLRRPIGIQLWTFTDRILENDVDSAKVISTQGLSGKQPRAIPQLLSSAVVSFSVPIPSHHCG